MLRTVVGVTPSNLTNSPVVTQSFFVILTSLRETITGPGSLVKMTSHIALSNQMDLAILTNSPKMCLMPQAADITSRPRWARAILDARIHRYGSQPKMIEATEDALSQTKLSRLERGAVHPNDLTVEEFFALLSTLGWTLTDYKAATGLKIPGTIERVLKQEAVVLGDQRLRTASAGNPVGNLTSATAIQIGIPGKPVRALARAGTPINPMEAALFHFPIPERFDGPDLELYQYEGPKLTIGTSYVQSGDIIAMVPVDNDVEHERIYVIRSGTETLVARCTRAGRVTLFVTGDSTRDAIPESKTRVLGRVPRYWNQHEA